MRQPAAGTYDPKRVDLVGFSTWSVTSAFPDEEVADRGRGVAEAMVVKGRAGGAVVPQLAAMCTELAARRPRTVTARMKPDASVAERLTAAGAMGPKAGEAFSDGQTAEIRDGATMAEVAAAIRRQGPRGPISEALTRHGRIETAVLDFPAGAETLSRALSEALAERHGCIVVTEPIDEMPDRIHLGIWSASAKSHVVAAADVLREGPHRFTLAAAPTTLHPLAWAVLQPTFRPTGANEMRAPSPLRGRRTGDAAVKAWRDAWRNADRINTAFIHEDHNELFRAIENAIPLPEELPDENVMTEVLGYVAATAPAMRGCAEHLLKLTGLRERLANLR